MEDKPQPLVEHLQELRQRIIYALISFVIALIVSVVFVHRVFSFILETAKANANLMMVQNTMGDAFMTEFRLAVILGLVLASPFVLYQIIAFILPALKPHERRLLFIGLPFATLLFVAGWTFGWFVVVPLTKVFFLDVAASVGVENMITPSAYISFVLSICNPLGIAFELPLVVLILARIGLLSARWLRRVRKFAFLGLMVLSAFLSPPDVVSMGIFMVPLYGLYELSILLAAIAEKRRDA